jgi:hypothetical protein
LDEPGKQASNERGSKSPTKTRDKPLSLYPLSLEEAVSILLEVKPETRKPRGGRRQPKT